MKTRLLSVAVVVCLANLTVRADEKMPDNPFKNAKVGDFVYRGDLVQTGANSAVGMVFTDGTAFNLSANARIELNEFVYDPNGNNNSAFISLAKGTFTFIAGKVAKTGDMKVDTPVATMGIRGTAPHVEISEDGTVHFATLAEEGVTQPGQPNKPGTPAQDNKRAAPAPQNKPPCVEGQPPGTAGCAPRAQGTGTGDAFGTGAGLPAGGGCA